MSNSILSVKDFLLTEAFSGVAWWILITAIAAILFIAILTGVVIHFVKKSKANSAKEISTDKNVTVDKEKCNDAKSSTSLNNSDQEVSKTNPTPKKQAKSPAAETNTNTQTDEVAVISKQNNLKATTSNVEKTNVKSTAKVIKTDTNQGTKVASKDISSEDTKQTTKEQPVKIVKKLSEDDDTQTFGKFVIANNKHDEDRPYLFRLLANNGQLLFESETYKNKPSIKSIKSFQNNAIRANFRIDEDKTGKFRYKLYSTTNLLIGVGESYANLQSCDKAIDSVIRFAISANIIEDISIAKKK